MARPREFDTDEVMEVIMGLFWAKGFDGTSLSDMEKATGLGRGSLVAAFGSKEALFLLALERYLERRLHAMKQLESEHESALEALEAWLSCAASSSPTHRGCFAIHVMVDNNEHCDECASVMSRYHREVEKTIVRIIKRGIASGEFASHLDAKAAARYLSCVSVGMNACVKYHSRQTARERRFSVQLAVRALRFS